MHRVLCTESTASESGAADPLTLQGDSLEGTGRKRSRKLLSRPSGPCTVQSATESTESIGKNGVAIFVSLDRVTKMLELPDDGEPPAGLQNTIDYIDCDTQRAEEKRNSHTVDPNDLESAEYAIDRVAAH